MPCHGTHGRFGISQGDHFNTRSLKRVSDSFDNGGPSSGILVATYSVCHSGNGFLCFAFAPSVHLNSGGDQLRKASLEGTSSRVVNESSGKAGHCHSQYYRQGDISRRNLNTFPAVQLIQTEKCAR